MANITILHLLGTSKKLTLGPLIRGSGVPVPCYPDLRDLLSQPKYLKIIAHECAKLIKQWGDIDCIAGCVMGGIALATATALETGKPLLLLRKNARRFGPDSAIDGRIKKGQRILVIDDSIVTGLGKRPYIEHLLFAKLRPVRMLTIIDVGPSPLWQRHRQWINARGVVIHSLVTWTEWALFMRDKGSIPSATVKTILRLMEHPPQWIENEEKHMRETEQL